MGCNAAELLVYHCCIRQELSETEMMRMAKNHWAGGGTLSKVILFSSGEVVLKKFVLMHIDHLLHGFEDFFDFFWHAFQMFVLAHQTYLPFRCFPATTPG